MERPIRSSFGSGPPPLPPNIRPSYLRENTGPPPRTPAEPDGKLKKLLLPLGAVGVLLLKFKGLLVALLKFFPVILKTGGTMLLTIWIYAQAWGWWFAAGFVILIFVHECGHLIAARRLGLKVGAPVFIPFMGALIALKEAPRNAWIEAQVGIGGPILGSVGGLVCYGLFLATKHPLFAALAYSAFFLNLFNLAPIGFLDGGRVATALSPWLWVAGAVVLGAMLVVHFNPLVLLILILSLPRLFSLFRKQTPEEARYFEVAPGQRFSMGALYFGLIALLLLGMKLTHVQA
jgi:Zn-dependent protease